MTVIIDIDSAIYKAGARRKVLIDYINDGYDAVITEASAEDIINLSEQGKEDLIHSLGPSLTEAKKKLDYIISGITDLYEDYTTKIIVLSPINRSNFRYKLCKYQAYKGNRTNLPKPEWFIEMREYLIKDYGAIVAEGMEADDFCAILSTPGDIVAAIDKDVLYGLPGNKFNYDTGESFSVTEEAAKRFFLGQCLTGDGCDNVKGLYLVGDTTASTILNTGKPKETIFERALTAYKVYLKGLEKQEIWDRFNECASLLWLKRTLEDDWKGHFDMDIVTKVLGKKVNIYG